MRWARYGTRQQRRLLVSHKKKYVRRPLGRLHERNCGQRREKFAPAPIHKSHYFIEFVIIDSVKFAVIALLVAASMNAQTSLGTSSLGGTITDSSGAFVPGAQIVLTDVQHGVKRNAFSNDSGNYIINGLPAGQYQLEVTKPG